MAKTIIVLLCVLLAVSIPAKEIDLADRVEAADVPQNKLFWGNFWIPLPGIVRPTAATAAVTTTATPQTCTQQMHAMALAPATVSCTCGTTTPMTCAVGAICVITAGAGACTATPLTACATATGSATPAPCGCPNTATPVVTSACLTTGMTSCLLGACAA